MVNLQVLSFQAVRKAVLTGVCAGLGMVRVVAALLSASVVMSVVALSAVADTQNKPRAPTDVVLQPHQAVYDLSLQEARSGSSVVNVRGRIVYELSGSACAGYTQRMRFVTETTNEQGETQRADLRTSSWEDVPARQFKFNSTTFQNDLEAGRTRGSAERVARTGDVVVRLREPTFDHITLSGGVYFPIEHSIEVIRAARAGKTILLADLYDGAETGAMVHTTSTAIGKPYTADAAPPLALPENGPELEAVPSRPISISYFTKGETKADAIPVYEMFYRFHENGIASALRIDQGDIVITGKLTRLSFLDAAACTP